MILLSNCQKETTQEKDARTSSTKEYHLTGKEILTEEISALSIYKADSFLLLYHRKMPYFYSIYHIKDLSFLGRLGVRGEGPEEWKGAFITNQVEREGGQLKIWINEVTKFQMIQLDLIESIRTNKLVQTAVLQYDPIIGFGAHIYPISDTQWIGNQSVSAQKKGSFLTYNPKVKTTKITPLPPALIVQGLNSIPLAYQLYSDNLALKPDKKNIVTAMRFFNRIDIYNSEGKLAYSFEGAKDSKQLPINSKMLKEEDLSSLTLYYEYITVSNKYIYALYLEQEENKYGEEIKPVEIHVFDWQANLIAKMKIPDYLISFCVDEDNQKIYGVSFYEEKVWMYDIPKFGIF